MKHALSVFLALVLCLSLCACQHNKLSQEQQAYQQILDMLKQQDYDGAHAAIDALAKENGFEIPYTSEESAHIEQEETESVKIEISEYEYINSESVEVEVEDTSTTIYIHNAAELFSIMDSAENTYILANDIDLSGHPGTIPTFSGILEGNGNTIYHSTTPLVETNNGTIQNINFQDCDIQLTDNAAAVAIYNKGSILNCTVSGMISSTAENAFAGGITYDNTGVIDHCINTASITAESSTLNELGNEIHGTWARAGGICASNSGTISRCVNHGPISSNGAEYISASGGIVSGNTNGEISNCFNSGTITSDHFDCGGIAGFSDFGKFINCYNIGIASSGIIGDNRDYIIDCYYLDSASSNGSGSGLNPEGERIYSFTQEEFTLPATFSTFDFDTIWIMTDSGPQLRP